MEITDQLDECVRESGVQTGMCFIFCRHTSASLLIQENADPSVPVDLLNWLARVAPDGDPQYAHDSEGPDDMAAHLRTAITRTSESIPIVDGRPALGTWQGLYLVEHRTASHTRTLVIHILGE